MPVTLQNLLDACRSHIDESVASMWTDVELTRWLNAALRDVARRTETLQSIAVIHAVADQGNYDAPADMLRIYRVEYAVSSTQVWPLEFQPLNSMDDVWFMSRTSTGTSPAFWSFWGFPSDSERAQIYVYPLPASSLANAIRVYYYRLPRVMTAPGDPADLPSGWEDAIALYVEFNARRKDNDRRWQEASELYEARIEQMISMTRQYSDQMQFVSRDTGSGGPWWAGSGGW